MTILLVEQNAYAALAIADQAHVLETQDDHERNRRRDQE